MTESLSSFTEFPIFEIPSLARPKLILKMSKQYMKLFTLQNIYMPPIEQLPICELPATFDIQKYSLKCKCSKETTAPVSLQHKGEIPYCLNMCIHQQDSAVLHRACTDRAQTAH